MSDGARGILSTASALFGFRRPLRFFDLLFDPGYKLGKADPETSCDRPGGLDGKVVFAALDTTHVGPMESTMICKRLLGKALLKP